MQIAGRLDHLAIAADSTDGMVAWYERVLGLVVHAVSGPNPPQKQKVYLIGPPGGIQSGSMIEVMPGNEKARVERLTHDSGLSHAAWYVADFDAALAHLKKCEVTFSGDIVNAVGGGRLISFLDCEGNLMQIVERK
jgi:glyoxylase I family protein